MQGGLSGAGQQQYQATAGPSTTASTSSTTGTPGESRVAEWLSALNLTGHDIILLGGILNVAAAGAMLLTEVLL
jgi:hypothetical protein